jgi:acetylornithine/N-succinyldiaminopimelate aminotransferase
LLIATAGDDIIRLVPPLVLERQHVDQAIALLEKSLQAIE